MHFRHLLKIDLDLSIFTSYSSVSEFLIDFSILEMVLNSIWSSDWDYVLFKFWSEKIDQRRTLNSFKSVFLSCNLPIETEMFMNFLFPVKLQIKASWGKSWKADLWKGQSNLPWFGSQSDLQLSAFERKIYKGGDFPCWIFATAKIDHWYNKRLSVF